MDEPHLVSVDGRNAPSKVHPSYEAALAEAVRLSPSNPNRCIRVLKQVAVLAPRGSHELVIGKEIK